MPWHWDTGHSTADPISLLEPIEPAKQSQMQQDKKNKFCPSLTLFLNFLRNGNFQDTIYAISGVYAAVDAFGTAVN